MEANYFTILWWVLSYIEMNPPWIYMCSPSRSPLPPPSPPDPSGSSQCILSRVKQITSLGWMHESLKFYLSPDPFKYIEVRKGAALSSGNCVQMSLLDGGHHWMNISHQGCRLLSLSYFLVSLIREKA